MVSYLLTTASIFLLIACTLPVVAEHGDDGNCKCKSCSNADIDYAIDTCKTTFEGRIDVNQCFANNSTRCDCLEFECAADDDSSEANCEALCAELQCNKTVYKCEANLPECFHEHTTITYKGRTHSLSALLRGDEPECHIPHIVSSTGVIVSALCKGHKGDELRTLRVTANHLVATSNGYVLASSLDSGDRLTSFQSQPCGVVSVTSELSPQKYFGLNCLESSVLADGIVASTFESFHFWPALYMSVVGRGLGLSVASKWGMWLIAAFY